MKKSLKKSNKIIILSVVLLALFCLNAFKAAHFVPVPKVSAEDEVLTWVTLDDLGINREYTNKLNGYISWLSLLETMTSNGTRSKSITENNVTISVNNYYNHVSGTGGEYVTFTKNTEISIDRGLSGACAIVITFWDKTNSSKENIIQFMNLSAVNSFRFADVTINGENFDEAFNESTNKYELIAIQLFGTLTAGDVRQNTIQPYFKNFYDVNTYNQYTEIDGAWILIANAAINNRHAAYLFNFDSMIAQISSVTYSENLSQYVFPVQQPQRWNTTKNEYRFLYVGEEALEDYILMPSSLVDNVLQYSEKGVISTNMQIGTFNTADYDTPVYYGDSYYLKFETGEFAELYEGTYENLQNNIENSNNVSLISVNAADSDIATSLINSLLAQLQMTVYTPAPPPPPPPETPETPDETLDKASEDLKNKIVDNTKKTIWLGAGLIAGFGLLGAGIYFGIVTIPAIIDSGVVPATINKINNDFGNGVIEGVKKIVEFIKMFVSTLITGIGTSIQEIIKAIKDSPTAQKVIYVGLIVLGIAASGFLTVYFIKKRKE